MVAQVQKGILGTEKKQVILILRVHLGRKNHVLMTKRSLLIQSCQKSLLDLYDKIKLNITEQIFLDTFPPKGVN